jgi:hypothetical protein
MGYNVTHDLPSMGQQGFLSDPRSLMCQQLVVFFFCFLGLMGLDKHEHICYIIAAQDIGRIGQTGPAGHGWLSL